MSVDADSTFEIRDMTSDDEYFVGTCSHVCESDEIDAASTRRLAWFRTETERGLCVKVAHRGGRPIAFLYLVPIEISPWGPKGSGLQVVPCLYVPEGEGRQGIGGALLAAAEAEARSRGAAGIVIPAMDHGSFWFMPASFFAANGYEVVESRGVQRLVWKRFRDDAEAPRMLERHYVHRPEHGKVVVDLFWNRFCLTSEVEAQRVRDVAADFGGSVVLHDHHAADPGVLEAFELPRAIYVDGEEITWGYEAPREGLREAIQAALDRR